MRAKISRIPHQKAQIAPKFVDRTQHQKANRNLSAIAFMRQAIAFMRQAIAFMRQAIAFMRQAIAPTSAVHECYLGCFKKL